MNGTLGQAGLNVLKNVIGAYNIEEVQRRRMKKMVANAQKDVSLVKFDWLRSNFFFFITQYLNTFTNFWFDLIDSAITLAHCPHDYRYAYLDGKYCCQVKQERPAGKLGTPAREIVDGTCDGRDFNRQSKCCKLKSIRCPEGTSCYDYLGNTWIICLSLLLQFNCFAYFFPFLRKLYTVGF